MRAEWTKKKLAQIFISSDGIVPVDKSKQVLAFFFGSSIVCCCSLWTENCDRSWNAVCMHVRTKPMACTIKRTAIFSIHLNFQVSTMLLFPMPFSKRFYSLILSSNFAFSMVLISLKYMYMTVDRHRMGVSLRQIFFNKKYLKEKTCSGWKCVWPSKGIRDNRKPVAVMSTNVE